MWGSTPEKKKKSKKRLKIGENQLKYIDMVITVADGAGIKCQAGEFSLLVDPPSQRMGNIILKTRTELPIDSFSSENIIWGSGEYEVSGVRVHGIALPSESTAKTVRSIYAIEFDGMRIAFLINVSSELSEDMIDGLGEVDILFFSADAKKIKPKQMVSLIKQIDPSIIIPAEDSAAKILMEEMGQRVKAEEKLTVKKGDLIKEDMANKLVWLTTK